MLQRRFDLFLSLGLFTSMVVAFGAQSRAIELPSDPADAQQGRSPTHYPSAGSAIKLVSDNNVSLRSRSPRRFNLLARRRRASSRNQRFTQQGGAATAASTNRAAENGQGAEAGPAITPDVKAVAEANNQFAFDLYQQLRAGDGNRFVSPASISTALAMCYAGAAGDTRRQMANVLHFDLPDERLHAGIGAINAILNTKNKNYRLDVANRLWGQSGFRFEAPFLKAMVENYGAEMGQVDFADSGQARQIINDWVAQQTEGKIANLLPPEALKDETRLVLTSAIYFKGTWQFQFVATATQDAPFHLSLDRQINVPTMNLTGGLRYVQVADTQLLELPYVGGHLSMVILLPTALDGLPQLEKQLTAAEVQKWIASLHHEDEVEVHLPKFTFTAQTALKGVLATMGMPLAFSDDADFSSVTTEKAQELSEVAHQAFVDVNEEGTEAAASTFVIYSNAPGPVPHTVIFRADHPFLFLIQDNRTGAILFLGRVVNPNA